MIDSEDAERMLALARVDLKAIRNMLDPDLFEDPVFGFHAQQAVEKAPKGWLTLRGLAYPKTHDLRLLMHLLETEGQESCGPFADLADLTDFAVQFRYDFPALAHALDRSALVARVECLIQHVDGLLGHLQT